MPIHIHKCKRCGHEWPSKRQHPTICPKCKSRLWAVPRRKRRRRRESIRVNRNSEQQE